MMGRRFLTRLRDEQRGVTIVEFALIAPVMCLVLVGAFDVSHTLYLKSSITGVVQKTARDASMEGSTSSKLDAKVEEQVLLLVNNAKVSFSRRFFRNFSEAAAKTPEPWVDADKNGTCNGGEKFTDNNNNNVWDKDGGDDGQGTAKDATVYTVTVAYPRLLPLQNFIPVSKNVEIDTTTILRNQPYDAQQKYGTPTDGTCK